MPMPSPMFPLQSNNITYTAIQPMYGNDLSQFYNNSYYSGGQQIMGGPTPGYMSLNQLFSQQQSQGNSLQSILSGLMNGGNSNLYGNLLGGDMNFPPMLGLPNSYGNYPGREPLDMGMNPPILRHHRGCNSDNDHDHDYDDYNFGNYGNNGNYGYNGYCQCNPSSNPNAGNLSEPAPGTTGPVDYTTQMGYQVQLNTDGSVQIEGQNVGNATDPTAIFWGDPHTKTTGTFGTGSDDLNAVQGNWSTADLEGDIGAPPQSGGAVVHVTADPGTTGGNGHIKQVEIADGNRYINYTYDGTQWVKQTDQSDMQVAASHIEQWNNQGTNKVFFGQELPDAGANNGTNNSTPVTVFEQIQGGNLFDPADQYAYNPYANLADPCSYGYQGFQNQYYPV